MIRIGICKCRGTVGSVCLSCLEKNIILNQRKTCSECKNSYINIKYISERPLKTYFEYNGINAKKFFCKSLLLISICFVSYILNTIYSEGKFQLLINQHIYLLILYQFGWPSVSFIHFLYERPKHDLQITPIIVKIPRKRSKRSHLRHSRRRRRT